MGKRVEGEELLMLWEVGKGEKVKGGEEILLSRCGTVGSIESKAVSAIVAIAIVLLFHHSALSSRFTCSTHKAVLTPDTQCVVDPELTRQQIVPT